MFYFIDLCDGDVLCLTEIKSRGAWLAPLERHVTLDFGGRGVSLSPTLGIEIT